MSLAINTERPENIQALIDKWLEQERSGVKFPVDFETAWHIAGYARKDHAKRRLSKLQNGSDFSSEKGKTLQGGRSSEIINLTCDAFKHFCLLAETEQGREIRQYFVECEKKWRLVQQHHPEVAQEVDLELHKLEMQLELARTQERLSNSQHKLLATVHLLETVAPGLAPLALGRPDAVITRNEYIERTITNSGTFEGVGITYIQKRFGFKSTKAAWDWLDSIGYGKDSGFWESQPALVHTPRLTPEHLEAVKTKFASKEGNRQMIFGE